MGYLKHQCAVAHNWGRDDDLAVMRTAKHSINQKWGDAGFGQDIVTEHGPFVNGSVTWLFAVDGSKEGWETSDLADSLRAEFVAACRRCKSTDCAEIILGGDDGIFLAKFNGGRHVDS